MIGLSELIVTSEPTIRTVKQLGDLLLSKNFFYKSDIVKDKEDNSFFNIIFYKSDKKEEAFKVQCGNIEFGKELCDTLNSYIYEKRIIDYYYL